MSGSPCLPIWTVKQGVLDFQTKTNKQTNERTNKQNSNNKTRQEQNKTYKQIIKQAKTKNNKHIPIMLLAAQVNGIKTKKLTIVSK